MVLGSPGLWIRRAPREVRRDGSDEGFQTTTLAHRRPAVYIVFDQLSRPRRDLVRAAVDFQGFPSHAGNQGLAAFLLLLVVRAHANSHWLVRRPIQFALALCR